MITNIFSHSQTFFSFVMNEQKLFILLQFCFNGTHHQLCTDKMPLSPRHISSCLLASLRFLTTLNLNLSIIEFMISWFFSGVSCLSKWHHHPLHVVVRLEAHS